MNLKSIFDEYYIPPPPNELRQRVLTAANTGMFHLESTENSFTERCWSNRKLHLAWLFTVITLFVFVQFWNPPLPSVAQNRTDQEETIQKTDEFTAINLMADIPNRNSEKYFPGNYRTLQELE